MKQINEINFVDLYIGDDFADITGMGGMQGRCVAPIELDDDIKAIRLECGKNFFAKMREEEFSLNYDDIIFPGYGDE
ncbi:hypothetical protein ACFS07_35760 [Undibacterium arcticum]